MRGKRKIWLSELHPILASFLCIFQFSLYDFFMFFPYLQMLINVNINDDDKKAVMSR